MDKTQELISVLTDDLSEAELAAAHFLSAISVAITSARVSSKMNQQEFSKFLGVSQGMISKYENGDYNFTVSKLCELAAALDLDLNISLSPKAD